MTRDAPTLTHPLQWPWALSAPPVASSEMKGWEGGPLRRWRGTDAVMIQPPLDHHYVVMHLDGAKAVERRRDGPTTSSVAVDGSLTIVPAGTAYTWRTRGPISFAHLYVRPDRLDQLILCDSDGQAGRTELVDRVACHDPILAVLFRTMLLQIAPTAKPTATHLDRLFESFLVRLGRRYTSQRSGHTSRVVTLAPHRLKRVLDFVEENLHRDIGLAELVAAAGSSQFHFSHAFRMSVGIAPYQYLTARRIELAKVLLLTEDVSLQDISARCGFNSSHQFAVMFKRQVGFGPKRYRMSLAR